MLVTVYHDAHYTFAVIKESEVQLGDVLMPAQKNGEVLRRGTVYGRGSSAVNIPNSQLDTYVASNPVTYERAVFDWLDRVGMQHHAEKEWWTRIVVDEEPHWFGETAQELEAYLNRHFIGVGV